MDTIKELKLLGERLRDWRIRANQTQANFAARIGVSVPTLRKMEKGYEHTAIRYWVEAIGVLGRMKDVQDLLREQRTLFDELPEAVQPRKRVRRTVAVLFGEAPVKPVKRTRRGAAGKGAK